MGGSGAVRPPSGRSAPSQGGALTTTRPVLYGLPFLFLRGIVAALRLPVACRRVLVAVTVGPGVGVTDILKTGGTYTYLYCLRSGNNDFFAEKYVTVIAEVSTAAYNC